MTSPTDDVMTQSHTVSVVIVIHMAFALFRFVTKFVKFVTPRCDVHCVRFS